MPRQPRTSEHLSLEIAVAFTRGRPLEPGEPVPGCACETCTGMSPEHPARVPAWRQQAPNRAARTDAERRLEWERHVDVARQARLLDVVRRYVGEPVQRGSAWRIACPFHEDAHPSLGIDPDKGLWYCFPCGIGGDGIELVMRVRGLDFAAAVKDLAA